ncbi:MAG: hypothetical protein ACHQFW_06165 [Chitinophagales bacterium]
MKFILTVVVGIFICATAQVVTPWWWIFAPVTFLISLLVKYKTGRASFFGGLLIVLISWLSIFIINDIPNDSLMSTKMAHVFAFKNNYLFFAVTSLVMGIIGGMASSSAYFLRKK